MTTRPRPIATAPHRPRGAKQEDALVSRGTALAERIALYIESYASAVATEAYNAGYAARESDPEAIALRMLSALDA